MTFAKFLGWFGFAIITLVIYYALKAYVLPKIKVNKWVLLGISIATLIIPGFVQVNLPYNLWVYISSGLFVILFLWFLDVSGYSQRFEKKRVNKISKKDDIIIRPKAKPNRVKGNISNSNKK